MSDKTVSVGLKIDGDASGAKAAINTTEKDLHGLSSGTQKTKESSDTLNASFSKLGIRSARQIEADILQVNQELVRLAQRTDLAGSEFDRAFAAGQGKIKQLRTELNGASGDVSQVAQRADGMISMMGKLGLAFSGAELALQFLVVNVELENMERTFRAITSSSQRASEEMAYVHDVADRLGLPLIAAGKAYADLSAATKGTAVEGQTTRAVFEAVARSMSIAGKTSADTEGALLALSQMASKGVVSMEELRGQLGERLPGALEAVADGFGITTAQLIKLVETGQLTAEELFPALATGLNKLYGATGDAGAATETLTQKWEHFKNGVAGAYKTIGDAGVVSALKYALEGLETVVVTTSVMIVALGKDIGIFFAALANGDIGLRGFSDSAKQAFAEVEKEAQDKLLKTAGHNRVMAASLDEAGKRALAAAQGQSKAATETAAAGASAAAAGSDWTKLNVAFNAVTESGAKATKQALENVEARKAEGLAAVELANAFGAEREKFLARADAARTDAVALGQLAERRREELAIAKGHLVAMEEEALAGGKISEARQNQIDELKKLVEARQAESDKATAQARSAAVATAAAETEGNAYADNSRRLSELKNAYEQAAVKVDALRAANAGGVDVTRQLESAEIKAGQAADLYRDALADQTAKIQQNLSLKQSQISVEQAGIRLAIEQQRTIADVARAKGDEYGATQALLQIKKLEIQLAELTAQAKRAEAVATLETVKAKREELLAAGALTEAKKLELQAQEAGARVKQLEGDIAAETARRMRELIDVTRDGGSSASDAAGDHDRLAGSLGRVAQGAGQAESALRSLKNAQAGPNPTKSGLSGYEDGTPQPDNLTVSQMKAAGWSETDISNYVSNKTTSQAEQAGGVVKRNVTTDTINWRSEAIRRGANSAQASAIADQMADEIEIQMDEVRRSYQGATSADPFEYRTRINGAYEQALGVVMNNVMGGKAQLGGSSTKPGAQQGQQTSVTINLNGRATNVNVASASDASALVSMLKELESSAARASL